MALNHIGNKILTFNLKRKSQFLKNWDFNIFHLYQKNFRRSLMNTKSEDKVPNEIPNQKNPHTPDPLKDPTPPNENNPTNPKTDKPTSKQN
jgi:hypothetical protein